MTNFQNKKKDFSGQKNKLGLSLRRKKRIFGSKIGKKGLFWAKILIKIEFKGEKLTSSQKKEKRTFRAEKKQAGAELKNKKRTFLGKNFEKN